MRESKGSLCGDARRLGMAILVVALTSWPVLLAQDAPEDGVGPRPLAELLRQLPEVASSGAGMNKSEQDFAAAMAKHGIAAADALVGLLDSEDPDVYQLVTYCLVSLQKEDFKPRHLAPMAKAARRKRDWLPNAIADVGTVEAAAFLAEEFRRSPQTHAQIDNALDRMAPLSIAPLLSEFRRASQDESEFLGDLAFVFRDCGERAAVAVEPLTTLALDPTQPDFRRLAAIRYLGAIGPSARPSFPRLRVLAEREPGRFAKVVKAAIAESRTPEAADLLIEGAIVQARTEGELYTFRELAVVVGPAAGHLTDRLIDLMDDPNPNVRLGACRTLGYLGNLDAWPHLARMLKAGDWRIAYSAALSLTQLGAKASRPSLEHCRASHWYSRVRHAADYALRRLNGGDETDLDQERLGPAFNAKNLESAFNSYDFEDSSLRPLDDFAGVPGLPRNVGAKKRKSPLLFFAAGHDWKEAVFPPAQKGDHRSLQTRHPAIYRAILEGAPKAVADWEQAWFGARVITIEREADATLVGITAGEWGGGVFVVEPGEPATWLLPQYTTALLRWRGEMVAFAGMTHMGVDYGSVHRIVREDDGWKAEFVHALPGCPRSGAVLTDGRLFANCTGGAVAISEEGAFEYLGSGPIQPQE